MPITSYHSTCPSWRGGGTRVPHNNNNNNNIENDIREVVHWTTIITIYIVYFIIDRWRWRCKNVSYYIIIPTRSAVINDVRARALICIFPRQHNDREVTCDLCVGARIIIIFKRYRRRRRAASTLSDSRQSAAARHVTCVRELIRHRLPVVHGAHLGSRRTPRGVVQIGFSRRRQ